MHIDLIVLYFYGDVGVVKEIVEKIFLDHITFVSQANNKIVESLGGINFHNMPEYRVIPYLNHRFRPQMGFFRYPGTHATCKNDNFHCANLFLNARKPDLKKVE